MALQTQVSATPEFRPWQQSCSTPGRALRYPSHVWPRRWACFLQALRLGPGARRDRQPRGHSWPGPELAAPVLVHLCLGDRGDAGVPPARWPCRAVPSLRQRPYRHQFRTRTNTPATRLLASWHPCGCAHAPTEARSLTLIPRLPPTRTPRRSPGWSRPVHADTPSSPPSRQLNCCQSGARHRPGHRLNLTATGFFKLPMEVLTDGTELHLASFCLANAELRLAGGGEDRARPGSRSATHVQAARIICHGHVPRCVSKQKAI